MMTRCHPPFDPPSTPFSLALPFGCSLASPCIFYFGKRSRVLDYTGKPELSSYIDSSLQGVFPPTHRRVVRTPCLRIREHWPGKCFALLPTLLSYMHGYLHHSIMHHLMHHYYMHRYIFSPIYAENFSASQSQAFWNPL